MSLKKIQGTTMQQSVMKAWWDSSHMAGGNAAYVEELYEAYLEDAKKRI